MKKWKIQISPLLIFLLLLLFNLNVCGAFQPPKNNLLAGASKIKITPETPIPMSGYGGRNEPFKGVHDDLFARVVVFGDGVNKAALVTTDLIGISKFPMGRNHLYQMTPIPKPV